MKQVILTLGLVLCCCASVGAIAQWLSDIDRVEIGVSSSWNPNAAKVGKAFGEALRMGSNANVNITDMDTERFLQFLDASEDSEPRTLRISIVGVNPANPLPSYTDGFELVGAIAEEPIVIFEGGRGHLEQEIEHATNQNPIKVGVIDSGSAFAARVYFRERKIPVDLSYEDDRATAKNRLRSGMIQALVGPKVMEDWGIKEVYSVGSFASYLPLKVPTAYGYLAFTMQNRDNAWAVAKAVKQVAENRQYRKNIENLDMKALYIGANTYRDRILEIGNDRCKDCICETDVECEDGCDKCTR